MRQLGVSTDQIFDLANRMKNRRVVATTKPTTDFRQRTWRQHLGKIHCNLTWLHDGTRAAIGKQVLLRHIVVTSNDALNFFNADALWFAYACQMAKQFVNAINREIRLERLTEQKLVECTFQFATRSSDRTGDMSEDIVIDIEA